MKPRGNKQKSENGFKVLTLSVIALAVLLSYVGGKLLRPRSALAQDLIPIGQIQGEGVWSDYQDQRVRFRAIVTGVLEDQNASGTRFYTVYVQDVSGGEDGNSLTSDGLAVFAGARRPSLAAGDIASFGGIVTEFYGLTELDNNGLFYSVESRNNPLPEPKVIDPPADNELAADYLERFEGMRVSMPDATVVGPSHAGCGFSVRRAVEVAPRIMVNTKDDPVGQIIGVLHPSDVNCDDMPAVGFGDQIAGLAGPLTYHFDRFKIVYQNTDELIIDPAVPVAPTSPRATAKNHLVIATFNVNNYFDVYDDTGDDVEPKPSAAEVVLKQFKAAATIAEILNCPDIVGLQEVENETLLFDLARQLAESCGFLYEASHLETPDQRGADVAMLSNPGRVDVVSASSRQTCTELETGLNDPLIACPDGRQPLFSRPPLQVSAVVDGQPIEILVNHFKSKRGDIIETAARRLSQAKHVHDLASEILASEPSGLVLVMGDFNDYSESPVMHTLLEDGSLVDALARIPDSQRYSYIFDGASQLIDWMLVSPKLADEVLDAGISHANADYPFQLEHIAEPDRLAFRASDHDIPYVVIDMNSESAAEQTPTVEHEPVQPALTNDRFTSSSETENVNSLPLPTVTMITLPTRASVSPETLDAAIGDSSDNKVASAPDQEHIQEDLGSMIVLAVAGLFLLVTAAVLTAVYFRTRKEPG